MAGIESRRWVEACLTVMILAAAIGQSAGSGLQTLVGVGEAEERKEAGRSRDLEGALEVIETAQDLSPGHLLRASFLSRRQLLYELYVEVLMQRHEIAPGDGFDLEALELTEGFRARSLLNLLTASDPQISEPPDSPLSTSEIMALLDEETLLLVYSLGEERSFLWQVAFDGVVSHVLPRRRVIDGAARRAYAFLQKSDQRGGRVEGRKAVEELSRLLLAPIRESLESQRLLVLADGPLYYVSFSALTSPSGRPLVEDHEIVSIPSASVLQALRRRSSGRPAAPKTLAVLADPVFSHEDPRFLEAGLSGAAGEFPYADHLGRLERSGQEAEAILSLVPPKDRYAALGFEATREVVLDGHLGDFRILHFATHGVLNDERPESTHLLFSRLDEAGAPRDGRLYRHEIADLELSADLVVLSACNSALGEYVHGEGVLGMTRAFLEAGATRLLVSLWFVSEEATAHLMERFYTELLVEGKSAPAALRSAQLWLQSDPRWQAPFYWAGFVLHGDWQ